MRTRIKPGRQIVLEVPGEGRFRIYTGGKGKPTVYRLVGKGSVERRVKDGPTLVKVAKSLRGYVDEHEAQSKRLRFRVARWIRRLPGRFMDRVRRVLDALEDATGGPWV